MQAKRPEVKRTTQLSKHGTRRRIRLLVNSKVGVMTAEDPYASMEKDQLISMIHFLVKREDERAQENQELKDMVKDLRDTHKQDVKTQTNLMKSIDKLTNQVTDLTTQNKTLQ